MDKGDLSNNPTLRLDQSAPPEELMHFDAIKMVNGLPAGWWTKKFWKFERTSGEIFYLPVYTVVQEA